MILSSYYLSSSVAEKKQIAAKVKKPPSPLRRLSNNPVSGKRALLAALHQKRQKSIIKHCKVGLRLPLHGLNKHPVGDAFSADKRSWAQKRNAGNALSKNETGLSEGSFFN